MATENEIAVPDMTAAFADACNTVQMNPEELQQVQKASLSHTANFNAAVGQQYGIQAPQANINATPGQPELHQQNPDILAKVENAALLQQIQPQPSGLGAELFGACCKGLEQAIQPVQEMVVPQPANVPEPPVQKTYTAELEMNKFSPAGPGGMAA